MSNSPVWYEQNPDQSIADALRATPSAPQPTRSDSRDQLLAKAAFAGLFSGIEVKTAPFTPEHGRSYYVSGTFDVVTPSDDGSVLCFWLIAASSGTLVDGPWSQAITGGQIFLIFRESGVWNSREIGVA